MKLNYFKAAEQDISSLPTLRKSLKNLEARRQRLIESGSPSAPGGIDYSKPYINAHYVNDTLNEILSVAECSAAINQTKAEIDEVEKILTALSEEQSNVLVMFYIERLPADKIAERIFVESDKTVYNIRNRAIANYALLAYGAPAKKASDKM